MLTDKRVEEYYEIPLCYFSTACYKLDGLHIHSSRVNKDCLSIEVDERLLLSEYEYCRLDLVHSALKLLQKSNTDRKALFESLIYYIKRSAKSVSLENFECVGSTIGLVVGALCAMFGSTLIFSTLSVQALLALSSTLLLGITLGAATLGIFGGAFLGAMLGFGIAVAINYVNVVQPEGRLKALIENRSEKVTTYRFPSYIPKNLSFFSARKALPILPENHLTFSPSSISKSFSSVNRGTL